jgi:hypothetical protein
MTPNAKYSDGHNFVQIFLEDDPNDDPWLANPVSGAKHIRAGSGLGDAGLISMATVHPRRAA